MDPAYAMPPCWQTQIAGCGTRRDFFSSLLRAEYVWKGKRKTFFRKSGLKMQSEKRGDAPRTFPTPVLRGGAVLV
jgi:hypothetical protein